MRVTYDPEINAAYIRLREKQGDIETRQVSAELSIDIDATGAVCGIELLNADEQLKGLDGGKIVFLNVFSGEESALTV